MNLLRIYRSTYEDMYSFALPELDRLRKIKSTRSFYGVLVHSSINNFKQLDTNTLNTPGLIIAIEDSFKDNTLELVPLKDG